jgi:imidazolonepropionase-like amidohydrolase
MKRLLLLLVFLQVSFPITVSEVGSPHSSSEAKAFVNGKWFTGKDFQSTTFYSVNGILTNRKPTGPVGTVDLQGGFVVPAFADAHSHFPSTEQNFETANRAFLQAGVFYVLNAGGDADKENPLRSKLDTTTTVDVVFAHSVFTCTGGHPKPALEYLSEHGAEFGVPFAKSKLEDHYFRVIDSVADIDQKWPLFLSTKPDFVKLVFVFSELYQSSDGSEKSMGLRPELAAELVHRAKIAGLRTGAHIEDAADFHNAVAAGVDMMMHLPAFPDPLDRQAAYRNKANWEERYTISASDIELAARHGITVVTTAAALSAENFENPNSLTALNENEKRFRKIMIQNLQRLKDGGVRLAVGSDTKPGSGVLTEIDFLKDSAVFSNLELLKMWSETTPRAVFPQRKIGALQEGYEANFLVLAGNPIEDFSQVKAIRMQVKHGEPLKGND